MPPAWPSMDNPTIEIDHADLVPPAAAIAA